MPIVRVGDQLVYFAHVPKCAGTSVEEYLAARFGPLAFLDRAYPDRDGRDSAWNRTSPQHIDVATFERLFPADLFAASFTVVRHPANRLLSSYRFERRLVHVPPGVGSPFRAKADLPVTETAAEAGILEDFRKDSDTTDIYHFFRVPDINLPDFARDDLGKRLDAVLAPVAE